MLNIVEIDLAREEACMGSGFKIGRVFGITRQDVRQLPVVRDGTLVGLLRRQDVVRWMQLGPGSERRR
jgi:CBS domain-containing protein